MLTATGFADSSRVCRLCTIEELQANEAAGTGCGFDANSIWSSTRGECASGQFLSAPGNFLNGKNVEAVPVAWCALPLSPSPLPRPLSVPSTSLSW